MSIFQIVFIISASVAGILAAWFLRKQTHSELLSILLSFSGAYLLGNVVLHLLPEIFADAHVGHQETGAHTHDYTAAIYILLGFFIQLLIVQFTRGIEHGHLHLHEHQSKGYIAGVFFGLSFHAFMEGVPLVGNNMEAGQMQPLFNAILVHKIPEAFALATVLFFSVSKQLNAYLLLAFFALMTPLGSVAGNYLTTQHVMDFKWLIAIVCGSLIHISTTIIFEASGKAHKISMYKFIAILAGAGIALLTAMME